MTYYGGGAVTVAFDPADTVTDDSESYPQGWLTFEAVTEGELARSVEFNTEACTRDESCAVGRWTQYDDTFIISARAPVDAETSLLDSATQCGVAPTAVSVSVIDRVGLSIVWEGTNTVEQIRAVVDAAIPFDEADRSVGQLNLSFDWYDGCGGGIESTRRDGLNISWSFPVQMSGSWSVDLE